MASSFKNSSIWGLPGLAARCGEGLCAGGLGVAGLLFSCGLRPQGVGVPGGGGGGGGGCGGIGGRNFRCLRGGGGGCFGGWCGLFCGFTLGGSFRGGGGGGIGCHGLGDDFGHVGDDDGGDFAFDGGFGEFDEGDGFFCSRGGAKFPEEEGGGDEQGDEHDDEYGHATGAGFFALH